MTKSPYFNNKTFMFLEELAANNNREWFQNNKERYEAHVKEPAIRFISDFGPHLKQISQYFVADPRPSGGSMFRIYRDVRFSKDKRPYKTNLGIQFRHSHGKDVHAPGFYLNIEPHNVFAGVGIWHPDSTTLRKIRDAIVENPADWKRASNQKKFKSRYELAGESLKRAPKGYDGDHPLIEDLRRKDFIGTTALNHRDVGGPDFPKHFAEICRDGVPLIKFLCKAIEVPF